MNENGNNNNFSNMVSPEELSYSNSTDSPFAQQPMQPFQTDPQPQVQPVADVQLQPVQQPVPQSDVITSVPQVQVAQPVAEIAQPMPQVEQVSQVQVSQVDQTPQVQMPVVQQPLQQPVQQPVQSVQQPIYNNVQNNVQTMPVYSNVSGGAEENKSIAKGLLITMIIIYICVGAAIIFILNITRELECTLTDSGGGISYKFVHKYTFKNDILKHEKLEVLFDFGDYYDIYRDKYAADADNFLKPYKTAGFKIEVTDKDPTLFYEATGSDKSILTAYKVDLFTLVTYDKLKEIQEKNKYVCK